MDDDTEVELSEGMPVTTDEGVSVGKLGALLIQEDEEEAEFLVLSTATGDRLLPFEAVIGVADGNLLLDVPADAVQRFPQIVPDRDPTEDEIELAYDVYDDVASGDYDDEDEE